MASCSHDHLPKVVKVYPPCNFESSEETDTPEDGEADGWHDLLAHEDELRDGADHHNEVKPEGRISSVVAA